MTVPEKSPSPSTFSRQKLLERWLLTVFVALAISSCSSFGVGTDQLEGIDKGIYYSQFPCIEKVQEVTGKHPDYSAISHKKVNEYVVFYGHVPAQHWQSYYDTPFFKCTVKDRKIISLEFSSNPFN